MKYGIEKYGGQARVVSLERVNYTPVYKSEFMSVEAAERLRDEMNK